MNDQIVSPYTWSHMAPVAFWPSYGQPGAFPIHELPPLLFDAVGEIVHVMQVPEALAAASALSCLSLVCQHLIKVQRPVDISPSPCSLFMITVAESGERKSASDSAVMKPIVLFQKDMQAEYDKECRVYRLKCEYAKAVSKEALKHAFEIKDEFERERRLVELAEEPVLAHPKLMRLLHEDATGPAFKRGLAEHFPSAGVISNEGLAATKSSLFKEFSTLNKCWDGQDFIVDRVGGSFSVHDPRVTLGLMIQPQGFHQMLERDDGAAIKSGFAARCLFAYPQSRIGTRVSQGSMPYVNNGIAKFHERINELLGDLRKRKWDDTIFECINMDAAAQQYWHEWQTEVECNLPFPGRLSEVRAAGSKSGENLARMAALFAKLEKSIVITGPILLRARALTRWYLLEYDRIVNGERRIAQAEADLKNIRDVCEKRTSGPTGRFPKYELQQFAALVLRKNPFRREQAFSKLLEEGDFRCFVDWSGRIDVERIGARQSFPALAPFGASASPFTANDGGYGVALTANANNAWAQTAAGASVATLINTAPPSFDPVPENKESKDAEQYSLDYQRRRDIWQALVATTDNLRRANELASTTEIGEQVELLLSRLDEEKAKAERMYVLAAKARD